VTWGPLDRPKETTGGELWLTTPTRPGVVFRMDAANFGPIPALAADWAQSSIPGAKAQGGS